MPYVGSIFTPGMKQRFSSLAEYLDADIETQEQLAARAQTTQATISRVAAGGSCSLKLAKLLARLTNVPIESFGKDAA